MPHQIINPVDAPGASRVQHLFNSYLYQIRSLEQVAAPPLSMATYAALVAADEVADTAEMGGMVRGLHVLSNSLQALADCLTDAYLDLEEFVSEGSDFELFAAYKRLEHARTHGYTDDADLAHDSHSLVPRTNSNALAPFQLHAVVAGYFASGIAQGERIGTSAPVDYAYYSSLVSNELVFTLRDHSQPVTPSNLMTYRRPEAQEMGITETEQPDERFEFDGDVLHGPLLVAEFNDLLLQGQEAAALYHSLGEDDSAGYNQLFELLVRIIDGDLESH